MDTEQQRHLEQLKQNYQRRLRILELQKAQMGTQTPPHIITEMEDTRIEVSKIEKELEKFTTSNSSTNGVIVRSGQHQTIELRVNKGDLELYLHDVRPRQDKGLRWKLTTEELKEIMRRGDITITENSIRPGLGFFDIGPRKSWYYSKELFIKPILLHTEIRRLIELAIEQGTDIG